ncbi:glycosyltransferase family 1 protein [Crucibulum laeve]|uniref:Glycosyltransferase family 1 protein n=1 Tax=Crucibulum laeve TaxID=68775 RepID=A0A5C3LT74_9AGAR|nr:glycosyltransferase family 1 protein [Crucibulum laeve]
MKLNDTSLFSSSHSARDPFTLPSFRTGIMSSKPQKGRPPPQPLHMREIDDDVAILPKYTPRPSDQDIPNATFVDMDAESDVDAGDIDYTKYSSDGKGLSSFASLSSEGCIDLSFNFKRKLPDLPKDHARDVNEFAVDKTRWRDYPSMNIVIMIVGSRGDVQPYVALGKLLLKDGHRVRIASHETFRSFVNENGLEFFNIGGNPQDLMSYMVKNPGLMPGMESLTNGDIGRKRKMLTEMINGCWLACHAPCPVTKKTFAADAIISNPPAFAHVHCAEALGIPLLSPTTAFPHPLVNIKQSNAEYGLTNYLSYAVADLLTWQGIGDIVNKFRSHSLGIPPLSLRSGPGIVDYLKVPWTYCMSPALVPKPHDWKNHIDVVGFYFLDLATNYKPPDDLAAFLAAGEPPVYIGFGSVVVKDSAAMTQTIFEATEKAGVRALVSAGWGGLGGVTIPSNVFILGNVPHDWLFDNDRVSAVVHHGGAGTTAIGLAKGRPTVVVPFFGDQGFWGSMIHKAGAGPEPVPASELNAQNLQEAIEFAISPQAKEAAKHMAQSIREEDGVRKGVDSFYRHLPLLNMRCDLAPHRLAVWFSTEYCMKLSPFAAQTLIDAKILDLKDLDPHRSKEYNSRQKVTDPATGGASAIFWTITHYYAGIAQIFYSPVKGIINTTTAIPRGIMKIVASVHEGFQNLPTIYGSEVRKPGKVTDFKSGLTEGGKSLFYGYYDGITGLVREPVAGAKKEGFMGAIKGSARSFANATMRPAAGILGLVTYPVQGAWKEGQTILGKKQEQQQRSTRISDGIEAVKRSSASEREEIIQKFHEAKKDTAARRKKYTDAAEKELAQEEAQAKEQTRPDPDTAGSSSQTTVHETVQITNEPPAPSPSSAPQPTDDDEEAQFLQELELATKLSMDDQKQYEQRVRDENR